LFLFVSDGVSFVPENWDGYTNILNLSKLLPQEKVFDSRLWMTPEDNSTLFDLYASNLSFILASLLLSSSVPLTY